MTMYAVIIFVEGEEKQKETKYIHRNGRKRTKRRRAIFLPGEFPHRPRGRIHPISAWRRRDEENKGWVNSFTLEFSEKGERDARPSLSSSPDLDVRDVGVLLLCACSSNFLRTRLSHLTPRRFWYARGYVVERSVLAITSNSLFNQTPSF